LVSVETMGSGVPAEFDSRLGSFSLARLQGCCPSFSSVWYAFPRASAEMLHVLVSPFMHNLSRATAKVLPNLISPFARHFPCASAKLLLVLHSPLRHHLPRATAELLPIFYSQLVHLAARISSGVTHFVGGRVSHSTRRALGVMLPVLSIGLAHVVPPAFGAMPAVQNSSSLIVSSCPTLRPMPRALDSGHGIVIPPVPSVMPHVACFSSHGITTHCARHDVHKCNIFFLRLCTVHITHVHNP
jgi:hypothetical protein